MLTIRCAAHKHHGDDLAMEASAGGGRRDGQEYLFKVLIIGELGTGKTSIIKRYVHQFFSEHYRATIGVDFAMKVINWDSNTIVRIQLWDIAGQERFGNMTRVYYKEAVGCFIVFDITRPSTFEAVERWKRDLDSKVSLPDGSRIPCVLLANKCDQVQNGAAGCDDKEMRDYCQQHSFDAWFETSAKDNINIEEAARFLIARIVELENSMSLSDAAKRGRDSAVIEPRQSSTASSSGSRSSCCS